MNHWLDNTIRHMQFGKPLRAVGVERLFQGWHRASSNVIGKLCTGAERWQAAIRQVHAQANVADALRARTVP